MEIEGKITKKKRDKINKFYNLAFFFKKPKKIVIRGLKRQGIGGCYRANYDEICLDNDYDFLTFLHENLHKLIGDIRKRLNIVRSNNLKLKFIRRFIEEVIVTYLSVMFGMMGGLLILGMSFCFMVISLITSINQGMVYLLIIGNITMFLLVVGMVAHCYIPNYLIDYRLSVALECLEKKTKLKTRIKKRLEKTVITEWGMVNAKKVS